MAIETGLGWKVQVDDAEAADPFDGITPTWKDLPQQRTGGLQFQTNDAEANHKDNAGWGDSLTVSRSLTVTAEGFADPNNVAYLYLVDTVNFGAATDHTVNVRVLNPDGDDYIFRAKVDSFDLSFGFDEVVGFTVSFTSRGQPQVTRA